MIFENEFLTVEFAKEGLIPGYVILHLKGDIYSMADLSFAAQASLSSTLAKLHKVINAVVMPERIYTLSIGEIQPRLHFHVFPRVTELLSLYKQANNIDEKQNISGVMLFEWARDRYSNIKFSDYAVINELFLQEFNK